MFPALIVVRAVGFTHYLHLGGEVWHFVVSGQETQVGVVLGVLVLLGVGEQLNERNIMLLFIYGSLKRGFPLHIHMQRHKFIGEALTVPGYILYDLGWYPGMKINGEYCRSQGDVVWVPQGQVKGELWEVDDFSHLDQVEGPYFRRTEIKLQTPQKEEVQTYLYGGKTQGQTCFSWEKHD